MLIAVFKAGVGFALMLKEELNKVDEDAAIGAEEVHAKTSGDAVRHHGKISMLLLLCSWERLIPR